MFDDSRDCSATFRCHLNKPFAEKETLCVSQSSCQRLRSQSLGGVRERFDEKAVTVANVTSCNAEESNLN